MRRFEGEVIVVSGTGSGLGLAAVVRLADEGGRVVGLDLDPSAASDVGAATVMTCDVRDAAAVECAIAEVCREYGNIDGLATFAGVGASFVTGAVLPVDGGWSVL